MSGLFSSSAAALSSPRSARRIITPSLNIWIVNYRLEYPISRYYSPSLCLSVVYSVYCKSPHNPNLSQDPVRRRDPYRSCLDRRKTSPKSELFVKNSRLLAYYGIPSKRHLSTVDCLCCRCPEGLDSQFAIYCACPHPRRASRPPPWRRPSNSSSNIVAVSSSISAADRSISAPAVIRVFAGVCS